MMSQVRCIRLPRKLLDDIGEKIVLRVPVFPRAPWREAQRAIAKRLNLFLGRVSRGFTFVKVFPFILGETRGVSQKVMDRHALQCWRTVRVVLADWILDV